MAEYIERKTAEHVLEQVGAPAYAIRALSLVKTCDVAPVVCGRWERCGRFLCECQECGEIYSTHENLGKGWYYCPNCGAKMEALCDE